MGKEVSSLQSGVTITGNQISGNLSYVTEYFGFSEVVEHQSGNFLALKLDSTPSNAYNTVEVVGSDLEPLAIYDDKYCVVRITEQSTALRIVSTREGYETLTTTFNLSGLILAPEA